MLYHMAPAAVGTICSARRRSY